MKIQIQLILAFFAASFIISCQGEQGVVVRGNVENTFEGGYVTLFQIGDMGMNPIDSVQPDSNGDFRIIVKAEKSEFYRIDFFGRQYANLIVSPDDTEIVISADGMDPRDRVIVTGSTETATMMAFDSLAFKRQSDIQLLTSEANMARSKGDFNTINEINEQYYYLNGKHNDNLKGMIRDAVPGLAGLYGINYISIEEEFPFADSIAIAYNANLPDHPFTKDLVSQIEAMRKLAIGANAPDISLPTPDGGELSLSSLKGNYVLIDFWAAWCRPCRMENPNVVRLYNQYQGENFEIFGVSLDRKRDAWLKAIDDDGLVWKHVSDLQYFNSAAAREYNITAIPATYLIDPDGKIMAKGLRGASLRNKLQEIFGS